MHKHKFIVNFFDSCNSVDLKISYTCVKHAREKYEIIAF